MRLLSGRLINYDAEGSSAPSELTVRTIMPGDEIELPRISQTISFVGARPSVSSPRFRSTTHDEWDVNGLTFR